jgi:hypothetical protein
MNASRLRLLTDLVATFVCGTAAVLILADLRSPARPYLVLFGLVIGSGWAVAGWIKLPSDAAYIGSVLLGAGLAVPLGVSVLLIEGGWWHPIGDAAVMLCVAGVLNLMQSVRDARTAVSA